MGSDSGQSCCGFLLTFPSRLGCAAHLQKQVLGYATLGTPKQITGQNRLLCQKVCKVHA